MKDLIYLFACTIPLSVYLSFASEGIWTYTTVFYAFLVIPIRDVITFDFSNTPRIVDVAVTALDHMCLTLEPDWNLDGISWVDGCSTTDVARLDRNTIKTTLFPNPGTGEFQISGLSPNASIEVFDPTGRSIHSAQPGSPTHTVSHTAGRGVYLIRIVDGEQRRTLRWVRQ